MRMVPAVLVSVAGLLVLLQQPTTTAAKLKKPQPWRGFFISSKDACETRCKWKHGYFWDPMRQKYLQAAHGKIYKFIMKCQCHTSLELGELIKELYGSSTKRSFSALSAIGMTDRARAMLDNKSKKMKKDPITFVSAEQVENSSFPTKWLHDWTEGATAHFSHGNANHHPLPHPPKHSKVDFHHSNHGVYPADHSGHHINHGVYPSDQSGHLFNHGGHHPNHGGHYPNHGGHHPNHGGHHLNFWPFKSSEHALHHEQRH